MTDNEIIEALECCGDPYDICAHCPIPNDIKGDCRCCEYLANNALDLITRQQAEIERLKNENMAKEAEYNDMLEQRNSVERYLETAKSEAVKEFVDRLKEVSSKFIMCDNGTQIIQYHQISTRKLDSILKEMVGEEE